MQYDSKFWLKFSLLNLSIVALLGVLMRYKIGFEFPFFNQKYILESHYHFAFYGWIAHTLMVLMVHCLDKNNTNFKSRRYHPVFVANLISSYGMLISFLVYGHGLVSGLFSLTAILATYYFSYMFVKDLKSNEINPISAKWFKAALFYNFLSTFGIFALAYMTLTKNLYQNEYLATAYYFLHFQYNGWFFFACMGLFLDFMKAAGPIQLKVFRLFFFSCIPAYFLSVLWMEIPNWLYILIVVSAFAQVYAWIVALMSLKHSTQIPSQPFILRYVILFVGVALSIKLLLQLGSTIPVISKLAFGFRPVVIAYLHLVLLAIITLFLLFYVYAQKLFSYSRHAFTAIVIFTIGVLLNEIVLAVQGIAAFTYTVVPFVNEVLFGVALILLIGAGLLFFSSLVKSEKNHIL